MEIFNKIMFIVAGIGILLIAVGVTVGFIDNVAVRDLGEKFCESNGSKYVEGSNRDDRFCVKIINDVMERKRITYQDGRWYFVKD